MAHARRRVVDVTLSFPAECRHILETLREVYRCDEEARAVGLAPANRLAAHQARSGPLLNDLHAWLTDQIDAHRIEPNSGLGQAIAYFLKHWTPLTLSLRVPGAPLDNNLRTRAEEGHSSSEESPLLSDADRRPRRRSVYECDSHV
jgi:hypothetical protein